MHGWAWLRTLLRTGIGGRSQVEWGEGMRRRNDRHDVIRDIIRTERITTQRALVESLRGRGYDCTQATVSRDIKDLNVRKVEGGVYALVEDIHLTRMVHDLVDEVKRTGNLALVKSSTGTASGVAAALDATELPGVMGSIAGDDTILVICEDEESAEKFVTIIEGLLPEEVPEDGEFEEEE